MSSRASASAVRHLKRADPRLAAVIARVGPCRLEPRVDGSHFDALARAIVYQQLSGKAAATILGRVRDVYGGLMPTPAQLLATPEQALRAAGLSRQKFSYLRSLAEHTNGGALAENGIDTLPDEEIVNALVAVKGIGKWTAQMFLIFRLGRPDVLPELDLGVRKGVQKAYRMRSLPTPARVLEVGAKWAPYRSVAAWYLWRSLENGDGQLGT
jgi:DNA-3-methyladenine glycosylase II